MEQALSFQGFKSRTEEKYNRNEKRVVAILFVRYGFGLASELLDDSFEYLDLNTGDDLDIFLPGYGRYKFLDEHLNKDEKLINLKNNKDGWFFSTKQFIDFKKQMEKVIKWKYDDEAELILVDYVNGHIDFSNVICINIESAIKSGAISTARSLLERTTGIISNKKVYNVYALSNCLAKEYAQEAMFEFISENIPMKIGKIGTKFKQFSVRQQ